MSRYDHSFLSTLFCIVLYSLCIPTGKALSDQNDLILTREEKTALDKWKPVVWPDLKEPFMKSDVYLIRWLRKAKLDVKRAQQFLSEMMQWREVNNISTIASEGWSDLKQDYSASTDSNDKAGRPVMFLDYGDWDLRAATIHGAIKRLQRYLTYLNEKTAQRVYQAQQEGKNVTRFVVVVDIDGFNVRQHGCPQCIYFLIQWLLDGRNYYPDFTDETILINVPSIGAFVLSAIRAAASQEVRNQIRPFDSNKKVWIAYLDGKIDKSQRTSRYGGTKI